MKACYSGLKIKHKFSKGDGLSLNCYGHHIYHSYKFTDLTCGLFLHLLTQSINVITKVETTT